MAKQLNVNMSFTADTSKAKQQIQELNRSLQEVQNFRTINVNDASIQSAKQAALDLQRHLNAAVDVNTGKLDLSKFSQSLTKSNQSLSSLYTDLTKIGPQGQQAFLQLAQSINNANASSITLTGRLGTLWTTLKNVARFQISSSVIHGIVGAVQGAYGYAQDLNESLNNIRIVTGQSTEQMARFAQEANKAARSLSATTLDYTNASLIYYQQGLSDSEVRERTDVTIKMANVARESAETVSEQMTAIWNNFDDGSKSLEYYADVITALGAATASSSSEISTGLEKFAAVADTVGLSYENATAALATITATTRQSADTVGTGLRTLFSRLQGLSLGDTLEDGVNLNKYSAALAKVGVQALDSSGQLRRMDDVLKDLGTRWGSLTKAQQTALAQTVGGVRQYTTLVALMDNWDFMKRNQEIAAGAEGTLQRQADIYAESWEAARDRVQAALEQIYDKLLNDEAFIKMLNGIEKIIDFIGDLIDSFGGLKGIITTVGGLFLSMYAKEIPAALQRVGDSFRVITGQAERSRIQMVQQANDKIQQMTTNSANGAALNAQIIGTQKISAAQLKLAENYSRLSAIERTVAEGKIAEAQARLQNVAAIGAEIDALNKQAQAFELSIQRSSGENAIEWQKRHEQTKLSKSSKQVELEKAQSDRAQAEQKYRADGKTEAQIANYLRQRDLKINRLKGEIAVEQRNFEGSKRSSQEIFQSYKTQSQKIGQYNEIDSDVRNRAQNLLSNAQNIAQNPTNVDTDAFNNVKQELQGILDNAKTAELNIQSLQDKLNNVTPGNLPDVTKDITNALSVNGDILGEAYSEAEQQVGVDEANLKGRGLWTEKNDAQFKQLGEDMAKVGAETLHVKAGLEEVDKGLDKTAQHTISTSEALGRVGASIMSLVSIVNVLSSTIDTLQDPDATGWDKFKSVMMAVGMTLPMAASGLSALLPAGEAAGAGLTAAMGPVGWIILAITALIAVIAVVTIKLMDFYNADAIAAEKATKTAKELQQAYQDTQAAAEALKDTFSKYDEAVEALNACTKGTKEWYEALQDVNNTVLDILASSPELAESLAYEYDKDGRIVIKNADELLAAANKAVETARYSAIVGQTAAIVAQEKADKTASIRNVNFASFWAEYGKQVSKISTTPSIINSNAAAGQAAMAGQAIAELIMTQQERKKSNISESSIAEVFTHVANNYKKYQGLDSEKIQAQLIKDGFEDMLSALKRTPVALNTFITELQSAAKNAAKANKVQENNFNLIANEALAGQNIDAGAIEISSEWLERQTQYEVEEVAKQLKSGTDTEIKALFDEYNAGQAIGSKVRFIKNNGSGDERTFDVAGIDNQESKTLSVDYVSQIIGAQRALNKLGATANKAGKIVEQTHDGMNAWIASGDFETLTIDQINKLKTVLGDEGLKGLFGDEKNLEAYLKLVNGEDVDIEQAKKDLQAQLKQQFEYTEQELMNFSSTLTNAVQPAFQIIQDQIGSLTVLEQKAIGNYMQQVFGALGSDGLNDLVTIYSNLTADEINAFTQVAQTFDWVTGTIKDFKEALIVAGVSIDGLDLDKFISAMFKVNQVTENATNKYKTIHDIIDSLATGSTITAERFAELPKGLDEYFVRMADGTYKLIADADTFYKIVNGQTLDNLQTEIDNANTENAKISNVLAYKQHTDLGAPAAGTDFAGKVQAQLDALELSGQYEDQVQLQSWKEQFANGTLTATDYLRIAHAVQTTNISYDMLNEKMVANNELISTNQEKIATSATTTAELTNVVNNHNLTQEQSAKGLMAIATQYEECLDDLNHYNKAIKQYGVNSDQASIATQQLWKSVRIAEWGKLATNVQDYLNVLKDSTKTDKEKATALTGLQKEFNKTFDTDITEEWATENQELFENWANASREEANDVGENIVNLAKLDEFNKGLQIKSSFDPESLDTTEQYIFNNFNGIKKLIEDNPIQVDAYGNADMTNLVSALIDAGATAEQVAVILAAIGQTNVTLGTTGTQAFDLSTPEGIQAFAENFNTHIQATEGIVPLVNGASGLEQINPGGGGGGGGGSKKPPKPERYHVVENKLQNNNRRQSAVSRDKGRAAGQARIGLLKEENKLREEALELQNQYEDEIRDWLDKDKHALIDAYATVGLDIQFDAEGEIANFEELEKAYVDFGDESNETWKTAKEALSQYEETLDKLNDKLEEITELQQAIADAALEMTQAQIELQLDISVDRFEYLDYLLDKIDDDAYQAAEAIAILGDKTAETMKKVNTYTEGLEAILAQHGFSLADLNNLTEEDLRNANFTQSEIDQIKDWRSELLQANQDLLEMRKTIVDKLTSAFDDLNEKVQKSYDNFDNYNSVLESYKNITDLMGRNISAQSRDIMNKLNDSMLRNTKNTAAAAKKIYDDAVAANAEAQAAYQAAVASGDYEAIRRWQEVIDATGEHLQEAEEQWLSSWENALELAKTRFEETMEDLAETYSTTMGGTFGSLDYLQEAYDRQKEINAQYLEDWDKLYELSKLSRDISKAIDDTDSIKAKEKLRALQAEINKLQADGTKLSEYDVQVLEKRFELEQARLALDDAQHAKSQVRLQRDANGNWGYVYTADEDEVAKAEQEYEDKLHAYQELNAQYLEQLQDEALNVQKTWQEAIGQIRSDLGLGLITEKEAEARLEEINKWLEEQQAYFAEQSQHALDNQASLYTRTLETYNVANAEIVDIWEETNLAMLTKINSLDEYMQNWNTAVQEYLANTEEALSTYQDNIDKINDSAGVTTTQFENHIDNVVVDLNNLSDDTVQNVSDLSDTMKNEFANALMEAVLWEQKYVDGMDEMITRNEQFVKSINLMIEALAGVDTDTISMLNPLSLMDSTINQSTMDLYKNTLDQYLSMNKDQILSMIDMNASAMASGLGTMSLTTLPALSENLEQNVQITASFPNATNHNEIEEAFTNLINKASQYANRKGL